MSIIKQLKYGILRMINYKAGANMQRFEKSVNYVTNSNKTKPEFIFGQYLNTNNPVSSMNALEKRWNNKDLQGRLFKHGIISFGSPTLTEGDALELVKETLKFYKEYPYLAALHTDVPNRLHAHFLLGMRNVETGKKFSQSTGELRDFRKHYNNLALKLDLPGLRDCVEAIASPVAEALNSSDKASGHQIVGVTIVRTPVQSNTCPRYGFTDSWPMVQQNTVQQLQTSLEKQVSVSHSNRQQTGSTERDVVNQIFQSAKSDFEYFFTQGFLGGNQHGNL